MKLQGRLIVILAVATLYSAMGYTAPTDAVPGANSVTANGVTVTTLTGPAATEATQAAQAGGAKIAVAASTPAVTHTVATTTSSAPTVVSAAPAIPDPASQTTPTSTPQPTAPTVTSAPAVASVSATAAPVAPAAATTVTATAIAAPPASAPAPVMQEQPTTVIEAAPLTTSSADDLRKVEEQTEVQTEQKIAEKLEQERIAAEKERQQQILNSMSSLTPAASTQAATAQPATAPQPPSVIVVSPAQNQQSAPSKDQIQEMVKEDISNINKPNEETGHYFMSGSVGQINYHSSDISSFGAASLSVGKEFPSNWDVSGDFGYSNNNVNQSYFLFQNMQQYSLGLTARYVFFNGMIRPSLGGAVDYVRRQYSGLQDATGTYYSAGGSPLDQQTTDAVDAGVVADIDLAVSKNFLIGLEYRYMMNVGYQYEGQNWMNTQAYRNYLSSNGFGAPTPLEQQGYDLTSLVIRYLF